MSNDPRFTLFAARAVFDARLTAMDVRVLAALGTFSDCHGWCNPSQRAISQRLGTGRTRVNASIHRLAAEGYVQTVLQTTEHGAKAVSLYRVLLDLFAPEAVDEAAQEAENADSMHVSRRDIPMSAGETCMSAGETCQDVVVDDLEKPPPAPPPMSAGETCMSAGETSIERDSSSSSEIRKKDKRATRLSPTWTPRQEEINFGTNGGLSATEVTAAADHMRDWAASSPKASKLNWDLTFRNWLRTTIGDAKRGRRPVVSGADPAERERRLWVFAQYGEWRADWGPKPTTEQPCQN